jgi:phosphoribosylformylglycinamidine cyclo-ligase
VGGETAEMPGVYTPPDFDLAGFIVGAVEEFAVLGADRVRAADALVAFESTGLHTNGYSLARRIIAERLRVGPDDRFPGDGRSTADVLLAVHRSYLAAITPSLIHVHAMAHITGGGLPGNLVRALPPHLDAVVDGSSWDVPNLFRVLQEAGGVSREEMLQTFNMGIGLVAMVSRDSVSTVRANATAAGVRSWILGHVVPGSGRVLLK